MSLMAMCQLPTRALPVFVILFFNTTAQVMNSTRTPERRPQEVIVRSECPTPCLCFQDGYDYVARCTGHELNHIPQGLPVKTTYLDIFDSNIAMLRSDDLKYLTHLQHLQLSFNRNFSVIEVGALGISRLTNIEIYGKDMLNHGGSGILMGTSDVTKLYLHGNPGLELNDGFFTNLPYLEKLNIAKTSTVLRPSLFQNQSTLLYENMEKLIYLNLENNNITEFPDIFLQYVPNLQVIQMGYNKMTSIGETAFSGNLHLREIYLEWNGITEIHLTAFTRLESLHYLDLTGNRLTTLAGEVLDRLPATAGICLAFNPLACDCLAKLIRDWTVQLGRANCPSVSFTTCDTPVELRGQVFTHLPESSLCPERGTSTYANVWTPLSLGIAAVFISAVVVTGVILYSKWRRTKYRRKMSTSSTAAVINMRAFSRSESVTPLQ